MNLETLMQKLGQDLGVRVNHGGVVGVPDLPVVIWRASYQSNFNSSPTIDVGLQARLAEIEFTILAEDPEGAQNLADDVLRNLSMQGGERVSGPVDLDSHRLPYFRLALVVALPV